MKKIFIIAAAALLSCSLASAQEDNTGWFAGMGLGMNFGFDGQHYDDRATSHNGAGIAVDTYFGKWFSSWGGFRAGFQGLSISNQYTDFGTKRYEYLHADMLIRAHRNIVPYVHAGLVRIDNNAFGAGAGIMFPIHVTKRIAIVPDFKATTHSNRAYETFRNNPSLTLSATVGVAIQLGRRPHRGPEVAVQPVTVIVPQTEIVHDTVVVTKVVKDTVQIKTEIHEIREVEKDIKISTISGSALFDTASDVLKPQAKEDLQEVVDWMKEHPDVHIEIGGHTDSRGSEAYNRDLSLRRAQSVKNYLVSQGAKASLISVRGYGYSQPVATNSTEEGRQQNRRVEIWTR